VEACPDEHLVPVQLREVAGTTDIIFRKMVPAFAVLREAGLTLAEWRGEVMCPALCSGQADARSGVVAVVPVEHDAPAL
jgi:hypothetical protein